MLRVCLLRFAVFLLVAVAPALRAADANLILHHGKVITVDAAFSIREAIAIRDGRILAVGSDADVLRLRGPATQVVDLAGRTVIPGLMDAHTHAPAASMIEFDHALPDMETIQDVLDYLSSRTRAVPEGEWIVLQQIFITRLREQRYPTRAELDRVAPRHPVLFRTGPDASVNSLALRRNGIDRADRVPAGVVGKVEVDAAGEPTGILRTFENFFRYQASTRPPTEAEREARLVALFHDYNSVGITGIADRNAFEPDFARYEKLRDARALTVRVAIFAGVPTVGPTSDVVAQIHRLNAHPLRRPDEMLRLIGVKIFLDGGMLTGSAYLQKPWGVSAIYSITDPAYRGILFVSPEQLRELARAAIGDRLQFTAHSVGDAAVQTLLGVYDELTQAGLPVRESRSSVTHSNFMSPELVLQAAKLGVVLDVQPAWLYLDTRTLVQHFGYDRLRWFQPWRSAVAAGALLGGGSDHMQKVGSLRSINPYNPFLGMATAVTRRAKWYDGQLHPEESLTREQALRLYTSNDAYALFRESFAGSLEPGKVADLAVLDTDLLTCPEEKIASTQVLRTYLNGRLVYERPAP